MKCSDKFAATLIEKGIETVSYDGYVPDFMPEKHYGDYVELDIDIETGQITNWTAPSVSTVKKQMK